MKKILKILVAVLCFVIVAIVIFYFGLFLTA